MLEAANPRELLGMESGPNQEPKIRTSNPNQDTPTETPSSYQTPIGPLGPTALVWHSIWAIPD